MCFDIIYTYGDLSAVSDAVCHAKKGERVLIAIPQTYLAANIWDTLDCTVKSFAGYEVLLAPSSAERRIVLPDEEKRFLEQLCQAFQITLLYGVTLLQAEAFSGPQEGFHVFFAHKGGVTTVDCRAFYTQQDKIDASLQIYREGSEECEGYDSAGRYSYAAWISAAEEVSVTEKGDGYELTADQGMGILRVYSEKREKQRETASLMQELIHKLVTVYEHLKKGIPSLSLGRFAPQLKYSGTVSETLKNRTSAKEPVREKYDLVVVGAGTSGVMAAIAAAKQGLRTALIEKEALPGGTQTLGGVTTYWFGCRYREVLDIDQQTSAWMDRLALPRRKGIWSSMDDSHGGIKSFIYLKECLKAGVALYQNQVLYDVKMEGAALVEVTTAGKECRYNFQADAFIDATGDGDLCVLAGAGYTYGSEEDHITFWASLAQYTGIHTYKNNFSSMTDCSDPADMTRFIRLGRQRGENLFDHGSMVSMRESRHIKGVYCISLKDVIEGKTYEDVLYTGYSNYDPKGKLDADMVYAGVLPPQVRMQIPLSALIPCRQDGTRITHLYVAGKAISATHNGFPALRMQPDLMHQGYVLGTVVARARKEGSYPELLTQKQREQWIREITDDSLTLQYHTLSPAEAVNRLTNASRTHWVDYPFESEETQPSEVISMMTAQSKEVLPFLLERLKKETKPYYWEPMQDGIPFRIRMIGWCLWHGCDEAIEEYCSFLLQALNAEALPRRQGSVTCANLLPDHGVMPELVYQINLLAWTKSDAVLPVMQKLVDMILSAKRDYRDIHLGIYPYIESVAYVAEHNGKGELAELIKKLLSLEEFSAARQWSGQVDLMAERLQILQLRLYSALNRLSDPEGEAGLAQMAEDSVLSRPIQDSAKMLLKNKGSLQEKKRW